MCVYVCLSVSSVKEGQIHHGRKEVAGHTGQQIQLHQRRGSLKRRGPLDARGGIRQGGGGLHCDIMMMEGEWRGGLKAARHSKEEEEAEEEEGRGWGKRY